MESTILNDIATLQNVVQGINEDEKRSVILEFARKYSISEYKAKQIARNEIPIKDMVAALSKYS